MKSLFKALSNFQNECPSIIKDTKGYGYKYAELSKILPVINPILKKHGLSYTQVGLGKSIKTIICHFESGEFMESIFDIPEGVNLKGMNDFQVLGSAITYLRRYSLAGALGIVTDDDNDASGTQIHKSNENAVKDFDYAGISKKLAMCNNIDELGILYNTLEEDEMNAFKPLFAKRKKELK